MIDWALSHWTWFAGGGGSILAVAAFFIPGIGPIIALLLKNWRIVLPILIIVGIGIDDGVQRWRLKDAKVAVAQKDTELHEFAEQQAKNIAAREKAVREEMQADIDRGNRLVEAESVALGDLQKRYNDALDAQSQPAVVDTTACDHTPASDAFDRGLSNLIPGPSPNR